MLTPWEKSSTSNTPSNSSRPRRWPVYAPFLLEERRIDEAIECGARAGKLDKLMAEAKAEMDAGIGEDF